LLCNGSINELSTIRQPFSMGSVPRGYLEDNWSDLSKEEQRKKKKKQKS
jgi:hypothetical protein